MSITAYKSMGGLVKRENRGGREIRSLQVVDFSKMTSELTFEKRTACWEVDEDGDRWWCGSLFSPICSFLSSTVPEF